MRSKRVIIIAGPDGAGKTTFAQEILPNEASLPTFVNADQMAAGLSPFNPAAAAVQAGRIMLQEIDEHFRHGRSFAFETTLSGRGYLRRVAKWRESGYHVPLIYLMLPSPEAALTRVARRVLQGGHDVPPDVVIRRYFVSRSNFEQLYKPAVDG